MVNSPTRIPDCDSHSTALMDLFISSDASICSTMASPPLRNSDHVVVSVSIDFPSNSRWDALFLLVQFVSGIRLELIYISLIVSIRSSLTHIHGFQLVVLLPQFMKSLFLFVPTE